MTPATADRRNPDPTAHRRGRRGSDLPGRSGFLLTWNPTYRPPHVWVADAARSSARGERPGLADWGSGGRKHGYRTGDRVFLLRQGSEPRGIVGCGVIPDDAGTWLGEHWDGSGRPRRYVRVDWEFVVDPDDPLPLDLLVAQASRTTWTPQGSGTRIADADLPVVERLWAEHLAG